MKLIIVALMLASGGLFAQPTPRQNLYNLLEEPVDLVAFKKLKGPSNSGSYRANSLLYRPDETQKGFYYRYMLFRTPTGYNEGERFAGFEILVFMKKDHPGDFYDTDEILIGIKSRLKDPDLKKLDLVGLKKNDITDRFGAPDIEKDAIWAYFHHQKHLVIKWNEDWVEWFKYLHLEKQVDQSEELPVLLSRF